jgi:hypothetical protein
MNVVGPAVFLGVQPVLEFAVTAAQDVSLALSHLPAR